MSQENTYGSQAPASPQVTVTVATFDRHQADPPYRTIRRDIPLADWGALRLDDYHPRGTTPLLDAVGAFIGDLGRLQRRGKVAIGALADESGSMAENREAVVSGINEFVAGMQGIDVDPKADGRVFALILTDGLENASREMTASAVRGLIAGCEADGWTFLYMGANQDAWVAGGALGLSGDAGGQRVTYKGTAMGTHSALREGGRRARSFLTDVDVFCLEASAAGDTTLDEEGTLTGSPGRPGRAFSGPDRRR